MTNEDLILPCEYRNDYVSNLVATLIQKLKQESFEINKDLKNFMINVISIRNYGNNNIDIYIDWNDIDLMFWCLDWSKSTQRLIEKIMDVYYMTWPKFKQLDFVFKLDPITESETINSLVYYCKDYNDKIIIRLK